MEMCVFVEYGAHFAHTCKLLSNSVDFITDGEIISSQKLLKNFDKSVELWSGEIAHRTQSRDTNQKRKVTCRSDWHDCESSTSLISAWAYCSTGSIQLWAHEEWMGADWQKLTCPLWRLTSAAMEELCLVLQGSPLERPSWTRMWVIFNKGLPASQHFLTQWPLPEGLEDFFHTRPITTYMTVQLTHPGVYKLLYSLHLL